MTTIENDEIELALFKVLVELAREGKIMIAGALWGPGVEPGKKGISFSREITRRAAEVFREASAK